MVSRIKKLYFKLQVVQRSGESRCLVIFLSIFLCFAFTSVLAFLSNWLFSWSKYSCQQQLRSFASMFVKKGTRVGVLWSACLCLYPPNSDVEILSPKMMVLGCRAFGRLVGHGNKALIDRISTLIKGPRELTHPFHIERIL